MNWQAVSVTEEEYRNLVESNRPIKFPRNKIIGNVGVEVHCCALGKMMNAVYDAHLDAVRKMNDNNPVFSEMPNRDLQLYNDFLLNPKVNTVIVDGFFGTAKTSTVCSHLVTGLVERKISQAFIAKPHESLGKTHGHLPGDLDEKVKREFQSFTQYFTRFGQPFLVERLMGKVPNGASGKPDPAVLEFLTFEYLRGRDIEDGWVVLDEAQNTDKKEMASFISRVNDPAKLIILGDSTGTQIDKRGNTPESNGLAFAKDTFEGKRYAGLVDMQSIKHILRGNRVRDLFVAMK
jgi:predicted ribonuclease YlaK